MATMLDDGVHTVNRKRGVPSLPARLSAKSTEHRNSNSLVHDHHVCVRWHLHHRRPPAPRSDERSASASPVSVNSRSLSPVGIDLGERSDRRRRCSQLQAQVLGHTPFQPPASFHRGSYRSRADSDHLGLR
jgi:hypothetical protein